MAEDASKTSGIPTITTTSEDGEELIQAIPPNLRNLSLSNSGSEPISNQKEINLRGPDIKGLPNGIDVVGTCDESTKDFLECSETEPLTGNGNASAIPKHA